MAMTRRICHGKMTVGGPKGFCGIVLARSDRGENLKRAQANISPRSLEKRWRSKVGSAKNQGTIHVQGEGFIFEGTDAEVIYDNNTAYDTKLFTVRPQGEVDATLPAPLRIETRRFGSKRLRITRNTKFAVVFLSLFVRTIC